MALAAILPIIAWLLASSLPAPRQGGGAVVPGDFVVEPPTLMSLGFEWPIRGDDNRNAAVTVQYRKVGESQWREALPLLRIGDEKVWRAREYLEYWTPRMFAGSITGSGRGDRLRMPIRHVGPGRRHG